MYKYIYIYIYIHVCIYIYRYIYIDFLNLNIPQLITYGCDNGCVMLYIHVYPGLMQGHEK